MAFVAANYAKHNKAPLGQWVCAPTSTLGPFAEVPEDKRAKDPDYCGQCVSYVRTVCPSLPPTRDWKKGAPVKGKADLLPGTVIATFSTSGCYEGHAAIYHHQNDVGITVYDQYRSGKAPKAIGPRLLRWGANGRSNNGDEFHVVID